jgi:hypothetical protein
LLRTNRYCPLPILDSREKMRKAQNLGLNCHDEIAIISDALAALMSEEALHR